MDDNKSKALAAALSQIEKQFGKGSIMRLGEGEKIEDIQVVSTGSLGLDIALGVGGLPRGRSGRALSAWLTRDAAKESGGPSSWRRIPVARGLELHVDADHPIARIGPDEAGVAEVVRQALAKLFPQAPA